MRRFCLVSIIGRFIFVRRFCLVSIIGRFIFGGMFPKVHGTFYLFQKIMESLIPHDSSPLNIRLVAN